MHKLPIGEAAEFLGISKEAVYNRIRRGSLKTVEKDGQKFVILEDERDLEHSQPKPTTKSRTSAAKKSDNSEFIAFLISELELAREQNLSLQADKERLFKEKEQMLIESKQEISQIYKERDEKLMAFLKAMQMSALAHKNEPTIEAIVEETDEQTKEKKWQNLSEFLREQNLDPKARKKAQKAIIKRVGQSRFLKFKDGVIFVKRNKTLKEVIQ